MGTGLIIANKLAEILAGEVVSGLIQKASRTDLDKKVEKALANALEQVAVDNDFWKDSVKIRKEEVLSFLVQKLGGSDDLETLDVSNDTLPSYLDKKTLEKFYEQLGKDTDTSLHLKVLVHDYILKGLKPTPIHFLTSSPPNPTNIIGRDADLQNLWMTLTDKKYVMLTGFGGIGKTKLAQLLFHKYEEVFDEVAWINYQIDLKKSILSCINMRQFEDIKEEEKRWKAIESVLSNDKKKKLFIIDNVDSVDDQHPELDKELKALTGWKNTTILLTSRLEVLGGFESISLESLNLDNCVRLFEHYYSGKNSNRETVLNLIELANKHTLTIELLAKGVGRENLEDYYKRLVDNGFEKIDRKVITNRNEMNAKIVDHLMKLFDIQQRSDLDKQILNGFAILPEKCQCSLEEIEHWFGFKDSDLDEVIQDGWLSYNKESERYFLHPLVRMIAHFSFQEDENKKKNIAPEGTAEKILDYFEKDNAWYDLTKGYAIMKRMTFIVESAIGSVNQEKRSQYPRIYCTLGAIYNDLGDYGKAMELFFEVLAIYKRVYDSDYIGTAIVYQNIGMVYSFQGNYDTALEYYLKALEIKEKTLEKEDSSIANLYNSIGTVYDNQGDYDKAMEFFSKALTIWKDVLGHDNSYTAQAYSNLGLALCNKNADIEALKYYNEALAIWEKTIGTEHPNAARTYNNIGLAYFKLNDTNKALDYYFKALEVWEKTVGGDSIDISYAYNNIGNAYYVQGDYCNALDYYFKALPMRERVFGINHQITAQTYISIGLVYFKKEQYSDALVYFEKALEILKSQTQVDNQLTREVELYKAMTESLIKDQDYVNDCIKQSDVYQENRHYNIAIDNTKATNTDLSLAASYVNRGISFFNNGNNKKAIRDFTKAIKINPAMSEAYRNRGVVYFELKLFDKAIADFTEVIKIKPDDEIPYYYRGLIYHEFCKNDSAIADYSEAIKLNPSFMEAYYNRGIIYGQLGQYDKALADYFEAIKLNPDLALPYNNIAFILSQQKKYEIALPYANKAIEIDPDASDYYDTRFDVFRGLGEKENALNDAYKGIEIAKRKNEKSVMEKLVKKVAEIKNN